MILHEKAINAHGWTGYGYIIIDPDTGAGAYLIEGKGNGAIFYIVGVMIGTIISMLLIAPKTASGLGKIAAILWPYLAAVAVGMGIIYAFASQNQKDFLLSCLYSGIMAPLIVGAGVKAIDNKAIIAVLAVVGVVSVYDAEIFGMKDTKTCLGIK